MPELPEVETVVRTLRPSIEGRRIVRAEVLWPKTVGDHEAGEGAFAARVQGRVIQSARRRAKLAIFELSDGMRLVAHLKMSGRLLIRPGDHVPHKHDRLILTLDSGELLVFNDTRKFGWFKAFTLSELEALEFYHSLGPEPLEIDAARFIDQVRGRSARIKAVLLDQRVIAGVGNIYADESLHAAGISPLARASDLSDERLARLHGCLADVLARAIAENGSSIRDYLDANGNAGAFQNSFKVYGRKGQSCGCCGHRLDSDTVAGRTSVWCPCCQK